MSWIPHITVASVIEKEKKYLLLKQKKDSISINCGYMEKYGQIKAKKKVLHKRKTLIK